MKKMLSLCAALIGFGSTMAHAVLWFPSSGAGWTVKSARIDVIENFLVVRAIRPAALGGGVIQFKLTIDYNNAASIARANSLLSLALSAQASGAPTYFRVSNEASVVANPSNQTGAISGTPGDLMSIQVGNDP